MSDLPPDVYRKIFLLLPTQWVLRCRGVCKEWRRLIDEPSFIISHSKNQMDDGTLYSSPLDSLIPTDRRQTLRTNQLLCCASLDSLTLTYFRKIMLPTNRLLCRVIPRLRTVVSCGGMFLTCTDNDIWTIWNVLTQKFHELTRPPEPMTTMVGRGFGYDSDGDHKVVTIHEQGRRYISLVYSMKSACWRRISDCPVGLYSGLGHLDGVFLNGALHWIAGRVIIVFDLISEGYEQLLLPDLHMDSKDLSVLDGCLVLRYSCGRSCRHRWLMMDDRKSWNYVFSLYSSVGRVVPVGYIKEKLLLLKCGQGFLSVNLANHNNVTHLSFDGVRDYQVSSCQISPNTFSNL